MTPTTASEARAAADDARKRAQELARTTRITTDAVEAKAWRDAVADAQVAAAVAEDVATGLAEQEKQDRITADRAARDADVVRQAEIHAEDAKIRASMESRCRAMVPDRDRLRELDAELFYLHTRLRGAGRDEINPLPVKLHEAVRLVDAQGNVV